MRCKTCDYALWNLPPEAKRACPECGSPFKPSDFTFAINSVQFRCPHCGQSYYGTDEKGHLVPSEFDCVKCAGHITMDDCLLTPAAGVPESQTRPDVQPWLERTRIGRWRAYWQTVGRSFVAPGALMRATPVESSVGPAWTFLLINLLAPYLIGSLPFTLLFLGIMLAGPAGGGGGWAPMVASLAALTIGAVVVMGVLVLFWALSAHALLHLTGPKGELKRTVEAICYSSGPNVLYGIPLLGCYIGGSVGAVWWLVSACIAIKEAHRVSAGRAALAGIAFPAVSLVLAVGLYAFGIVAAVGAANRAAAAAQSAASQAAQTATMTSLGVTLRAHALTAGGRGPEHIVELIVSGKVRDTSLIAGLSSTTAASIPVADTTLDQVMFFDANQERILIDLARKSLPPSTVAYRLGDVVFTYTGIDFNDANSQQLWTAVMTLDPAANSGNTDAPSMPIVAVLVSGTTTTFTPNLWPEQLESQNQLRAAAGLAPLPRLDAVRHESPAVAPDPEGKGSPPPDEPGGG